MKLFHLSDLHIGKQLYHYNMSAEQRHITKQIVELAKNEKPDAVLIAGDIYDSQIPSAEAVSVFDEFLRGLCSVDPQPAVLIIAGNHDSAKRLDFASSILAKHRVYIAGMPPQSEDEFMQCVRLSDSHGEVCFYLLPFVKPSYVRSLFPGGADSYDMAVRKLIGRETVDRTKRNVIVSHQFYTAGGAEPQTSDSKVRFAGGIENVDISVLEPFDYAALGHIHRSQQMGRDVYRYCGTPLQYSVSEADALKSVTVVELSEKGVPPLVSEIPLVPLRAVRRLSGTLNEITAAAEGHNCHDFVSITLTDEVESYQPKERLEQYFDHILEIRIDNARTRKILSFPEETLETIEPYEAFCAFFAEMNGRAMTGREEERMRQVFASEMEGAEE